VKVRVWVRVRVTVGVGVRVRVRVRVGVRNQQKNALKRRDVPTHQIRAFRRPASVFR